MRYPALAGVEWDWQPLFSFSLDLSEVVEAYCGERLIYKNENYHGEVSLSETTCREEALADTAELSCA